jgi:hypothetical protein
MLIQHDGVPNQPLEATAAAPGIMTVTGNRTSSASAPPLARGCASAFRWL